MEEDSTTVEQFDPSDYDLPAGWNWLSEEQDVSSGKITLHFGHNSGEVDGWFGEIDNYPVSRRGGEEKWDIHCRTVEAAPEGKDHDTVISVEADTNQTFDSLEEALDAVVGFIESNYPETIEA